MMTLPAEMMEGATIVSSQCMGAQAINDGRYSSLEAERAKDNDIPLLTLVKAARHAGIENAETGGQALADRERAGGGEHHSAHIGQELRGLGSSAVRDAEHTGVPSTAKAAPKTPEGQTR